VNDDNSAMAEHTDIANRYRRQLWVGVLVILISAGAGFLIYGTMSGWNAPPATNAAGPPTAGAPFAPDVQPDTEPAPTPPTATRSVPEVLPDFTLANREGKPTKLSSFAGRPLLVNFWATWCAPCRREIPLLNELRAERASQGLEVVGVAVDFRDDVLKYVAETRVDYPLLIGEEDGLAAADAFGIGLAFPVSIFADKNSRILAVKVGELHRDEAEFILDRVADVDRRILAPAVAKAQIGAKLLELAQKRAKAPPAA
jgi:thiol-disulfide isomerase/thioredoxin